MVGVSPQPGLSPADENDTVATRSSNGAGGGGRDGSDPVRRAQIGGVSGGAVARASAANKEDAAATSSGKFEEMRSPQSVQAAEVRDGLS